MASQLIKLALLNPADYTEALTFSVVQDGVAEATRQVMSIEPDSITIEDEQTLHTSKLYNLTVAGVFSESAKSQLRTWSSARTELAMVGYGLDGEVFYATGPINVDESYDTHLSFYFTSPRRAVGGYASTGIHSAQMIYDKNAYAYHQWATNAGGWTHDGTFSSGSLTLGNGETALKEIEFPFQETVTVSILVSSYTGNPVMYLYGVDSAGDSIAMPGATLTISSNGRRVIAAAVPANAVKLGVLVVCDVDDEVVFSNPAFNMGTKTSSTVIFSEFNT
jgi:hypothetical protein